MQKSNNTQQMIPRKSLSLISEWACVSIFFRSTRPLKSSFSYRKVRPVAEDTFNPLEKPSTIDKGALHVVAVPIGNLKDFTYRAVDVLRNVDYIVTSDRPATKTLLDLVQIPCQGRLIHYSAQNKSATTGKLVEMLTGGRSMALVTTSGTPCVGDVGAQLVQAMLARGVRVTAVPGASAVLAALSCCGETSSVHEAAPPQRIGPCASLSGAFFFGHMLPSSHTERLRVLRNVIGPATYPCVFYEIPRRLLMVLEDIAAVLPGRRIYITHELTKLNESVHADRVERLVHFYRRAEARTLTHLGQLVILIAGASPQELERWMGKMLERRAKFRVDVSKLLEKSGGSANLSLLGVPEKTMGGSPKKSKKKRAALLRRRHRMKLLKKIRLEQERLQLSLLANRSDSQKSS